jgi:hypothetical protein
MPQFRAFEEKLRAMKLLTAFSPKLRADLRDIERQLRSMTDSVDGFYDVLAGRDWVYHEQLDVEAMRGAIEGKDPIALEAVLIDRYTDPTKLNRLVMSLKPVPNMTERFHLVELARDDHLAGRYYATTLTLLAVMDGFVNEIEKARRGLSSRDAAEINPWNSVTGHHLGLKAVHRTFTKTFKATSTDEIHSLYRNGIVHGNLPHFNNVTVASKAWNRLLAVADWAKSLEAARQPPEPPPPPIRDSIAMIAATARRNELLKTWTGRTVTVEQDGVDAVAAEPVAVAASSLFEAWQRRNYGGIAVLLREAPSKKGDLPKFSGEVRRRFERSDLARHEIVSVQMLTSSSAVVIATITVDGETFENETRWLREDVARRAVPEFESAGEWRSIHYYPDEYSPRRD